MSWFGKRDKTTRHSYFEEKLSAYIDGELTPREQEGVKHHLATCPTCRWDLSTLEQTVQQVSELPTVQVPRAFTIPASAEPVRPTRRRWTLLPALQGATALVALLLVFAVAGDVMLTGFGASSHSELPTVHDGAAVVETTVIEKAVVEREVEVTVVAEQSSEAETPLALEMPEPPAAEPEGEMMLQMAPSLALTTTGPASADLEETAET
ncbi:MAG: anti-sigma factor family protein, partial [Anaerolineae bacterium]